MSRHSVVVVRAIVCLVTCFAAAGGLMGQDSSVNENEATGAKPRAKSADDRARELSARLKSVLNQEPEQLVRLAREISASVTAALDFDCELAELEQRQALLEQRQEQLQAMRDAARAAADMHRAEMDARLQAIRKQFGSASTAEAQQTRVTRHYAEQVRTRQEQAGRCEKDIQKVNAALADMRSRIAEQQLARELVAQSGRALVTGSTPALEDSDLDFDLDLLLDGDPTVPASSPTARAR